MACDRLALSIYQVPCVRPSISIAVHTDDLVKNQFWHVVTKFKTRVLNPFQRQNMKKTFFGQEVEGTAISNNAA